MKKPKNLCLRVKNVVYYICDLHKFIAVKTILFGRTEKNLVKKQNFT